MTATAPTTAVPTLLGALVVAGCDLAPTEPTLTAPSAAAPATDHGRGSQFVLVPGPTGLIAFADEEGDECGIGYSAQNDRNDFIRTGRDGTLGVHTSDQNAPLEILHQGVLYTGVATAGPRFAPGTPPPTWISPPALLASGHNSASGRFAAYCGPAAGRWSSIGAPGRSRREPAKRPPLRGLCYRGFFIRGDRGGAQRDQP